MSQPYPLVYVYILEIRTAFLHRHGRGCDVDLVEFPYKIKSKYSGNTAHVSC